MGRFAVAAIAGASLVLLLYLSGVLGWIGGLSIGLPILGLIGWLGPKAYEQFDAAMTQRRTFVQETTKRVVDLSGQHYWGLANAAGTLAGVLQDYMRSVEAHLLVTYSTAGGDGRNSATLIRERLRAVAEEAAGRSFPALVRTIILFQRFQFSGSNTYLLPHHASGDALRRLYNRFVLSLPEDPFLATIRRRTERHLAEETKTKADAPPFGLSGSFLEDPDWKELDKEREIWRSWLTDALPRVYEAAEALDAYADLIAHELALLNAVFFRDRQDGRSNLSLRVAAADWAGERWPHVLNEQTLRAIARADHMPRSFVPLGAVADARLQPTPEESTRSAAAADPIQDPGDAGPKQ